MEDKVLTEQESNNISEGFFRLSHSIDNMINLVNLIDSKCDIVCTIILSNQRQLLNSDVIESVTMLISKETELQIIKKQIETSNMVSPEITDQYKTFLQTEIVTYNLFHQFLFDENSVNNITTFINKQTSQSIDISPDDANVLACLSALPNAYLKQIALIQEKMSKIYIFDRLKEINGNIVMVGANGSGKSTFARQLNGRLSDNVTILSAQHILFYSKSMTISASGDEINRVHEFQKNSKLGSDPNLNQLLNSDMNNLISALMAEHTDCALQHYNDDTFKRESILSLTINLWHEIIEHRSLVIERSSISVKTAQEITYPFNHLSDGEKAIFYYIGHILLATNNSYIVVDEPENHLHLVICNKLWDRLEQVRLDCKFIYLTHNLDFATSRTDTTILWNKSFLPPFKWDFDVLPTNEIIPEVLIMELVGSRKNICFCEGDNKSSIDYKLYSILFQNYTIIPVTGHRNVIDYTDAYNSASSFPNKAIGIIDGDCHLPDQIEKWNQKGIYVLQFCEIENLLCDKLILDYATERFLSGDTALEKYFEKFWKEFEANKEQQAVWYVNNYINNLFKDNYLHEKRNLDILKEELLSITSPDAAENLYIERLSLIEDIIEQKDYILGLKIANFKGKLTKDISKNTIVDKYVDRVLDLIKKDSSLKSAIVKTFFDSIPN